MGLHNLALSRPAALSLGRSHQRKNLARPGAHVGDTVERGCVAKSTRRQWLADVTLLTSSVAIHPLLPDVAAAKVSIVDVEKGTGSGREIVLTSTGIKYAEQYLGSGSTPKTGDLVLVDVVGSLSNGKVFLDTKQLGAPLAFQLGTTNKFITEGLSQMVETMASGGVRLAVVPASLGYGEQGMAMPQATVPPNASLRYEIELLRCQLVSGIGLACCSEAAFPCIKDEAEVRKMLTKPGPE